MADSETKGTILIKPTGAFASFDLAELWNHRELIMLMAWRDIIVRYKQTVLGVVWVLLQPLLMTIVFTVLFHKFGRVSDLGTVSYMVSSFVALQCWQFYANSLNHGAGSIVAHRGLITKVYFPRLIIPLVSMVPAMADFIVCLCFLPILMVIFHVPFSLTNLAVILLLPWMMLTVFGPILWCSGLISVYRDFRIIVPFMIQFLMFASPIAYTMKIIPPQWRSVYALNPLAGTIEMFRWAILGTQYINWHEFVISMFTTVILLITGLLYFKRVEAKLADVV